VRSNDTQVTLVWDMPMPGRAYGSFTRSYNLPESLDEEKLVAELADGVLTVRIPKLPEAQPRKIQVTLSSNAKQLGQ
jgi:HSP20 family protein